MGKDIKPTKEQIRKPENIFVLEETIKAGKKRLRNRGSSVYDRYYQRKEINNAVSYTHLTLPTIPLV